MKILNKNNFTESSAVLTHDFQEVYVLIREHKKRVAAAIGNESLRMLWEVGGYVSKKLKSSAWGDGVVTQLSEYIRTQDSTVRGWSYRTIYKMVQFYDTYSRLEFGKLVDKMNVNHFDKPRLESADNEIVPIEMAQINEATIVPFEMAQIPINVICCFITVCCNVW